MKDDSDNIEFDDDVWFKRFSVDARYDFRIGERHDEESDQSHSGTIKDVGTTIPMEKELAKNASDSNTDATAPDPLLGQKIGNYEITRCLGRGGFGSVYQARDVKLDRYVALKFLRFPLDPEYRKLFAREARVLANLSQHASIVQVYTWGEHQGSYYFALEFLDSNVENLLEQSGGKLSVRRALEIVTQCAAALHYAHNNGVFHRDVKPANILVDSKTNRAKLCDFGLARFKSLGVPSATAHLAGSPPYMAPEQVAGKEIDARTDVYGLGVTLYELLSGRLPFAGREQAAVLEQVRSGKYTPLEKYRPDLAPSIIKLVRRSMAWHPRDRFQTAAELENAAQKILNELDSSGSVQTPTRYSFSNVAVRRLLVRSAVACCVAAVLIGVAATALRVIKHEPGKPSWPIEVAQARELVDAGDFEGARSRLEWYLEDNPTDQYALYVLGFANFLLGDFDKAEKVFSEINNTALRLEGIAAVRHARKKLDARPEIEDALILVPTRYPVILLASLDILEGKTDSALVRLEAVQAEKLNFDWQRRDLHRLLGQVYASTGDIEAAQAQLASMPQNDVVARVALADLARQQDAEYRKTVREHIDRIKANTETKGSNSRPTDDLWTSRPITMRVEPAKNSEVYFESTRDVARFFPGLLADHLALHTSRPITITDREYVNDALFEQEFASAFPNADSIETGKLVGARFSLVPEFGALLGQEFVRIQLINTETTQITHVGKFSIKPGFAGSDLEDWLTEICDRIGWSLAADYPLQGRVLEENGKFYINIGRDTGVSEGMIFNVYSNEKSAQPLDGLTAIAIAPIDTDECAIRIDGASHSSADWCVRETATATN